MTEFELIDEAVSILGCDTARISSPAGRHFLIIGWNRRSEGEWFDQHGNPKNFDYVEERVVAHGNTLEEVRDDMWSYKGISQMSWDEYFKWIALQDTAA